MLTYLLFHANLVSGWVWMTVKAILTIIDSIPPWINGLLGIIVARIRARRAVGPLSTLSVVKPEPMNPDVPYAEGVLQVNVEAVHRLIATELTKLLYRIRRRRLLRRQLDAHADGRIKNLRRYVDDDYVERLRSRLAIVDGLRETLQAQMAHLPPERKRGAVSKAVASIALVLLAVIEASLTYSFVDILIQLPKGLSDYTLPVGVVFAVIVSGFAVYAIHHSAGIRGPAQSRTRVQAWSMAVLISGLAAYARFSGQLKTLTLDQILAGTARGDIREGIPQFVLSMLILVIAYGLSSWSLPQDEGYRCLLDEYHRVDKEGRHLRSNLRWWQNMDTTVRNLESEHGSRKLLRDEQAKIMHQQFAEAYIQRFVLCGLLAPGDRELQRMQEEYERQLGRLFSAPDQTSISEIIGGELPRLDDDVIPEEG